MHHLRHVLLLAALVLLLGAKPATHTGKVVSVTDGDTIQLRTSDETIKIRLAGIDAPEKKQAYGTKAKQRLSKLVFGKQATVTVTTKDRYGRSIGVIVVDGVDCNLQMVRDGFAWHYTQYSKDKKLAAAELTARKKRLGLWTETATPMAPWEFRRLPKKKQATSASDGPLTYWLNTSGNVRHNSTCRWHENTKRGRECGASEGKACGICGG